MHPKNARCSKTSDEKRGTASEMHHKNNKACASEYLNKPSTRGFVKTQKVITTRMKPAYKIKSLEGDISN
jgi:hypothetical protein